MLCCFVICPPLALLVPLLVGRAGDRHPAFRRTGLYISPDGTIEVTETIEAQFIGLELATASIRTIPIEYTTPAGT